MQKIGTYEYSCDKTHFLGKGSFSEVYLGKFQDDDTPVAIKIIKTTNLTPNAKKIVNDEIEIMESIKQDPHPNIVECYDIYQDTHHVYIVMEYCDSGSLKNIMKKCIKEKYIQFYFSQLANGLRYLDKKGIVHRDIKPRNILLTNNRRILKIADFGFARKTDGALHDTICGSPLYMAPEMIRHDQYNNQTDLWSIGMILYEMLFGYHPYDNCKTIPELKNTIAQKELEIPPKNNKNKDISESCVHLLTKLLQKNTIKRITWEEFFCHPWIDETNKYSNKKQQEDYKKNICATSLGSLSPNLVPTPSTNKYDIINDYYDSFINQSTTNTTKVETTDPEQDDNECIFEMELGASSNHTYTVKEIIDKKSVLKKGKSYNVIN